MALGFHLAAPAGFRSPTVTNVTNNLGLDIPSLNEALRQDEMEISDGYGAYKGKAFRIAHMGETTVEDMKRLLDAISSYMQD